MNRQQHLEWCKERALAYVKAGDYQQAFMSISSDLTKHPETENHIGIELGMIQLMSGQLNSAESMTKFITGFN